MRGVYEYLHQFVVRIAAAHLYGFDAYPPSLPDAEIDIRKAAGLLRSMSLTD